MLMQYKLLNRNVDSRELHVQKLFFVIVNVVASNLDIFMWVFPFCLCFCFEIGMHS